MRAQQEIKDRFEARKGDDWLGFEVHEYIGAMDLEHAKPYLKEGVVDWEPHFKTDEDIRKAAIDYMEFAWDKANNFRGISAGRSISHYIAWLWMLGDDEIWPTIEDYSFYGKPQLRTICEYLEINADQWDDGVRLNSEP